VPRRPDGARRRGPATGRWPGRPKPSIPGAAQERVTKYDAEEQKEASEYLPAQRRDPTLPPLRAEDDDPRRALRRISPG
jgi:hypothetical protein